MNDRVVEVVLRYEQLRQRGQSVTAEELCSDRPELLEDVRSAIARLQAGGAFMDTPPIPPGTTVGYVGDDPRPPASIGAYEVLAVLGKGGMGVVYQARHRQTKALVAIKLLRDGLDSPQVLARFHGEAEVLARLRHPNLVQLLETGEHEGRPFLVMELVTGGSLPAPNGQPVEPSLAAQRIEVLARAVAAAHEAGIIHRDLKPSNVLVGQAFQPDSSADDRLESLTYKITDFGLAKRLDVDLRQTSSGAVLGTPSYMSPEQAAGLVRQIGPASDVWSLGVMLYEMLTGRLPFVGGSAYQTLQQVCEQEPVAPRQRCPEVPRDLETICLKCLRKEPAKRYAGALELADDLRRFQEDRPIRARRVGLGERLVKWRRRNPVKSAFGLVGLLVLLIGAAGGTWYWDRNLRVKVEYYSSVTSRFGVKHGIGKLSEAEARQRRFSYKVYRRQGRVERVDVVNGQGELTTDHLTEAVLKPGDIDRVQGPTRKECRFEYVRNEHGEVLEEWAFDRHGNVVWVLRYPSPDLAYYSNPAGAPQAPGVPARRRGSSLGTGFAEARTRSGAGYLRFDWSPEGFAREVRYLDRDSQPHPDDGGAFGERLEHDERGLVVRQTYIGKDGKPITHAISKVAIRTTTYDEAGHPVEQAVFAADGKPVFEKGGAARVRAHHDEHGNVVELAYFDTDGKPTLVDGFHRLAAVYDQHGNQIESSAFDQQGRPTLRKDGIHKVTAVHDERGNPLELAFFGSDGKPTLRDDGTHRLVYGYNGDGTVHEVRHFGLDNRPVLNKFAFHRAVAGYDEHGRAVELRHFGVDDRPVLNRDGAHRLVAKLDERGNPVGVSSFGIDDQPVFLRDGAHRSELKLNPRGNVIEKAFFGTDGQPMLDRDGTHLNRARYDDRGNHIEESYFGLDRQPVRHRDGYHRWQAEHDDRGNLTEMRFYGVRGEPVVSTSLGAHLVRYRYDQRDNQVEQAYFGTDGQPTLNRKKCHKVQVRHDERGNWVEMVFLDVAGRPVLNDEGVHRARARHDARGNEIEQRYFGVDDRPVRCNKGHARVQVEYNDRDQRARLAFFDSDGKPMLNSDRVHGFRQQHDERGNVIETSFFGIDGKPCLHAEGHARTTERHDARGNVVEIVYYGLDNRPVMTTRKQARVVLKYDDRDYLVEQTTFDARGRPLLVMGYDRQGRLRHIGRHLDPATAAKHGKAVAVEHSRLDEKGNIVERSWTDSAGKLVPTSAGWAGLSMKYDDRGRVVEEARFGPDRKLFCPPNGFARHVTRYDERGNLVEAVFYGADGKLAHMVSGISRAVYRYDAANRKIESSTHDDQDRPVLVRSFDARGRVTQQTLLLPPETAKLLGPKVYRIRQMLDERGEVRAAEYLDSAGKLVETSRGDARYVVEFDGKGNESARRYFNAAGKALVLQVVIETVLPGGQGAKLGLQVGDILVRYAGAAIRNTQSFVEARAKESKSDKPRPLVVERKGKSITVQTSPGPLGVALSDRLVVPPMRAP